MLFRCYVLRLSWSGFSCFGSSLRGLRFGLCFWGWESCVGSVLCFWSWCVPLDLYYSWSFIKLIINREERRERGEKERGLPSTEPSLRYDLRPVIGCRRFLRIGI